MGGVVSVLICLFCRSGCQASVVASALAFQPPEPFYQIEYDEASKNYKMYLSPDIPIVNTEGISMEVHLLDTSKKTKIPLFAFKYPNAKYTMIYSHGNATDIGAMYTMFVVLCKTLQINVVGYDYTGYGASMMFETKPTEKQTYIDIERVYHWCKEFGLVTDAKSQVILYGQSVGSGPSCFLASKPKKFPIAGLCLHSPILSGLRVITENRLLACFDIFPNISRIKKVDCPVFIIHGENDKEVDFEHGIKLQQAVPDYFKCDPWWVPDREHNDVLQGNEHEYIQQMSKFLVSVGMGKGVMIHSNENDSIKCNSKLSNESAKQTSMTSDSSTS